MRRWLVLGLVVSLCSVVSGCDDTAETVSQRQVLLRYAGGFDPTRYDAGPLPSPGTLAEPLRFSLPAYLGRQAPSDGMPELSAYLSSHAEVPVEIVVTPSHEESLRRIIGGEVDVATLSPMAYALAVEDAPNLIPLVSAVTQGSSTYASYFVVRIDSTIATLADLRTRRVAFVDRLSTSGYLLPSLYLREQGIDPARDVVPTFSGGHPESIERVLRGDVDAAAVASDRIVGLTGLSGPLRVLAKAGRLPYDIVVARPDVPPAVLARVRDALLRLSVHTAEGRQALARYSAIHGFMPIPDGHYDVVKDCLRELRALEAQGQGAGPAVPVLAPRTRRGALSVDAGPAP